MKRTVILKHTLPDGSWHYDWFIQISEDATRPVLSFRTGHSQPDSVVEFEAHRLRDHRAMYLDYEGAVSENRGDVVRVGSGEVVSFAFDESYEFVLCFGGRNLAYFGQQLEDCHWRFIATCG